MGCFKSCCQTCLSMCCLIPMAWIAFTVFDLGAAITGGALIGVGDGITILMTMLTGDQASGGLVSLLVGGIMGVVMVTMFPMHWLLTYRPDEPMYAIALMIPWVLTIFISALLFSKSMKDGFMLGIKVAIGYIVLGLLLLNLIISGLGSAGAAGIIDGVFKGLTDLSPFAAILMACLEGGLIGGVFGALAGAIRYDPTAQDEDYSPKKSKGDNTPQYAFGQ